MRPMTYAPLGNAVGEADEFLGFGGERRPCRETDASCPCPVGPLCFVEDEDVLGGIRDFFAE